MAFGRTFEKLLIRITGDDSDFTKSVRRADRTVDRLTRSAGKLALGLGAVGAGAAAVGTKVFQIGSDALETQSKFDTVFGEARGQVQAFLDDFGTMAGLSRSAAQEITATTGAIVQGFGFAQEESAAFAEEIVRLSGDLGSFNNIPTAEVAQAIQAALAGEREQLKRLGIVLRQADVDERALLMTRKESAKELTDQEKAIATLQLVSERAGVAVGDLARTQDSAANRAKQLRAEWANIAEDFSVRLIPALEQILPVLEELTEKAAAWAETLAEGTTTFLDMVGISDPVVRAAVASIRNLGDDVDVLEQRYRDAADRVVEYREELQALADDPRARRAGRAQADRAKELRQELEAEMAVMEAIGRRLAFAGQESREFASSQAAAAREAEAIRQAVLSATDGIELGVVATRLWIDTNEELEVTLGGIPRTAERVFTRTEELGADMARGLSRSIVDSLDDGMYAFRRFADYAIDQLLRIGAQRALFEGLSFLFPGAGFVTAFGRSIGALPGGAYGSPARAGTPYRVMEFGRSEVFIPNTSGRIEPAEGPGARAGAAPMVLDVSKLPRPTDPRQASRDADWIRFLSYSLDEYRAAGGRLTTRGK